MRTNVSRLPLERRAGRFVSVPAGVAFLLVVACSSGSSPPARVVSVDADIVAATAWTSDNVYVVTVPVRVVGPLAIAPGTLVLFWRGAELRAEGAITALGSAAAPIVFTSSADDGVKGDVNGDGAATAPAPGDWDGIALGAGGSTFDHCKFLFAGGGGGSALAVGDGVAATVTGSTFAHVGGKDDGMRSSPALDAKGAAAGTVIAGNTFFDNLAPVWIGAAVSLDDSNAFDDAAATPGAPKPNKYNGVFANAAGTETRVTGNVSWTLRKVPIVVGTSSEGAVDLGIDFGGHLTLGDGAVVKFQPPGILFSHQRGGALVEYLGGALTVGKGVVFTSIYDDAHGGDTDADPAPPAPTDWRGISLGSSGTTFDGAQVLYTGAGNFPALEIAHGASILVRNSTFAHHRPQPNLYSDPAPCLTKTPALLAVEAGPVTTITGNVFYDDVLPLGIGTAYSLDDSNVFENPAAPYGQRQPSECNGVVVSAPWNESAVSVRGDVVWSTAKVPIVVGRPGRATDLVVEAGASLTLDGAIVKFHVVDTKDAKLRVLAGGRLDVGDAVLTSVHDDAYGGDTNGDHGAVAPADGDWYGVSLDGACRAWPGMHYYGCTAPMPAPPSLALSAEPEAIPVGGIAKLRFTIGNPNAAELAGIAVVADFSPGLVVATPDGAESDCPTWNLWAPDGGISFTSQPLAAGAGCIFSVNVTATSAGVKEIGAATRSLQGGPGPRQSAVVTVGAE